MKRIKLSDRTLPRYSRNEEIVNTLSHCIGAVFALVCIPLCISKTAVTGNSLSIIGAAVYGISMLLVYTVSALYHGLAAGTAKKVLQILDHCTIYTLIAGTYTPVLLSGLVMHRPIAGYGLLAFQWITAAVCIILNAIDLRRYRVISMIAYILMGWSIIFIVPTAIKVLSTTGLLYILWGGISYTFGAILYGIGAKLPWFHSIFHFFVLLGSLLQFIGIYLYIL